VFVFLVASVFASDRALMPLPYDPDPLRWISADPAGYSVFDLAIDGGVRVGPSLDWELVGVAQPTPVFGFGLVADTSVVPGRAGREWRLLARAELGPGQGLQGLYAVGVGGWERGVPPDGDATVDGLDLGLGVGLRGVWRSGFTLAIEARHDVHTAIPQGSTFTMSWRAGWARRPADAPEPAEGARLEQGVAVVAFAVPATVAGVFAALVATGHIVFE
jgi:hypothetical protein